MNPCLVMILTEELSKEMGLKSFTQIGPSILGIRVIKELLMILLLRQKSFYDLECHILSKDS